MTQNNIIGRQQEIKELEDAFNSNQAELIAVYGRRRIGKTCLIRNFFSKKNALYFEATGINKGTMTEQLERFSNEIGNKFYHDIKLQTSNNWMNAFETLTKAIETFSKQKKITIFLDELPWLATPKSGLIKALEYFWNRHWSHNTRIKLVVCGSTAAWIIKKIIKNKGGLHNRVTRRIKLTPFNLNETKSFLKHLGFKFNEIQITKLYMATGGVPFYLKNLKKNLSIEQNINELFFDKNGIFFDEFDEVFTSLFDNSEQYKELILLISKNKIGISRHDLEKKSKLTGAGGRLTQRLDDLETAGFITSYIPFQHKKRGIFYRLTDEYCLFYLKWIHPTKQIIKQNPKANHWKRISQTPSHKSWQGYAFENICYKHVAQIKRALNIDESTLASPWQYIPSAKKDVDGTQIDLVLDRNDDAISLCEIKFSEKPYLIDKAYAKILLKKLDVFKKQTNTEKQLFIILISASGLNENIYSEDLLSQVVTAEDLFT